MVALPIVESQVQSVTVYREGARVVRRAQLQPAFGSQIMISNLPLSLIDDTLRVRVLSGAAVATDLRVALDVPAKDASLPPARSEELQNHRLEADALRARLGLVERERDLWGALKILGRPKGGEGKPPPSSPHEARSGLLKMRRSEVERTQKTIAELTRQLEELERRIVRLEDDEERRSSARQAQSHELRKAAVVTLRDGAGPSTLALEYLIPGARWAPAYTLQLSRDLRQAQLSLRAMVAQRSGEDWSGVQLHLSTAEAASWSELPELQARRIGRRQERPDQRGFRPPPVGTAELFADYDRAFAELRRKAAKPLPETAMRTAVPAAASVEFDDESATLVGSANQSVLDELRADGAPLLPSSPAPAAAPMAGPPPSPMQMAPPAAKRAMKKSKGRMERAKSRAVPAPEMAPEPEEDFGAPAGAGDLAFGYDESLLQYGLLRLFDYRSTRRGALRQGDTAETYLDHVQVRGFTALEITQAFSQAQQRARGLARLPERHRYAWSDSYDYAYSAESTSDVASDGEYHSLPLGTEKAAGEPLYVCVPREANEVFRTVAVDNPLDAPLLAGPADVYWDGEYLLTSDLDTTPPDGKVELGLGVEQGLKVARNTSYSEDTVGLMGGALELSHEVKIEVANRMGHGVPIEIRERIPVTREGDDDIEIHARAAPDWKKFEPDPRHASDPDLRGGYAWRAELNAGEERAFKVKYDIKLPSKYELVGGNRRDR